MCKKFCQMLVVLVGVGTLGSCSDQPEFGSQVSSSKGAEKTSAENSIENQYPGSESGKTNKGATNNVGEGAALPEQFLDGEKTENFQLSLEAAIKPKVDYVFVVDNSDSMRSIISGVRQGFTSIASKALFPEDSRVGVMSMTVQESASSKAKLVGFLQLANKKQITNSKRSNSSKAEYPGCDSWFEPSEKDAKGNYCLVSASQFTLHGLGVEAGITAFQRTILAANKGFFRKNALVNVIFVSDTHEPGKNNAQLIAELSQKGYPEMEALVKGNSDIQSLRFHAIAPIAGKCSSENTWGFSLHKLVDASGGTKQHCLGADYESFMTDMVKKSVGVEEVSFALPANVVAINSVEIDGNEVAFQVDQANREMTVQVNPADYPTGAKVDVEAVIN